MLIVGAGPAGVSAALWAHSLHLDVLVLEGGEGPGGQLLHVHFHPRELPGLLAGDGRAIAAAYAQQLADAGVRVRYGARADALRTGERPAVAIRGGEWIESAAVLICSGARRRRLHVPGEEAFTGHGISTSATRDRERLAGRDVMVVGGGDAAYENALLLAHEGCRVTLLVRGSARARREFRAQVAAEPRIEVREHTEVLEFAGDTALRALRVRGPEGEASLACEAVVVKVGVIPNTEWCRGVLAHDAEGYLRVDAALATSAPGVWAAGDVTRPLLASVPVSAGQGALAVAAIRAALGRA